MAPSRSADADVEVVDLSADEPLAPGVDPAAWDVDDDDGDPDDGWPPRSPGEHRRRRRARWGVAGGALAVVVVLLGASELLRSPQERLERRLDDALAGAGVQLAEPVSLRDDGSGQVWTGRLQVVGPGGDVSGVRVALRPDPAPPGDAVPTAGLFPLVDCTSPYPLSWAGDSDTSFRTTRRDLAECTSDAGDDGAVLVTISWRSGDDDDSDAADAADPADEVSEAAADGAGRQTWSTDALGGVAWLHNGTGGGSGATAGLTGAQQRAVATAEGLLDPL